MTAASSPVAGSAELPGRLRAKGYRLTAQRQLVLEAVEDVGHGTAEEILAVVQRRAVGVNLSTVYRALALLEDLGLIRHNHLKHGSSTYTAASQAEHVHLVCRNCENVQSMDPDQVTALVAGLEQEHGFQLDVGHATLHGLCNACASTAAR